MHLRLLPFLASTILVGCVAGCAPRVLEKPPVEWPQTWCGRQLFNTPHAYVYARSPALAGYVDRMSEEVGKDFEKATGRQAPKGLLVITDAGDEPVIKDFKAFFLAVKRAEIRAKQKSSSSQPTTSPETQPSADEDAREAAELETAWQGFEVTQQETGLDMKAMLEIAPVPLTRDQICDLLGLPPGVADQAGWAVLVGSEPMVRRGIHTVTIGMLKNPELGLAARIAAAPLLLAMEPKMVSMMLVTHKAAIFEQMARQQPDWTEAEVSKLAKAYKDGQLKPVMEALEADAKKHAPKAAVSQPASAPSSQPDSASESRPATVPDTRPSGQD